MKANKTMMAGALAAALFTIGAQAAETVKTEDVKVTATRVEKDLSDVNMSVSVITAEDIKHSTARNVGELLQSMTGVEINPDGSQGLKRASIRGENSFRTVVMIDGQKVAEHKSMSGAPMLIDVAMIERIEVIKGPVSVLYGSDAIGGAINIITKKGGEDGVQSSFSAGYNSSADGWSTSAAVFGQSGAWKYRLNAAAEDNGNLETPAGEMDNTSFSSKSIGGFLSYDITEDTTVGLTLDYFDLATESGNVAVPKDQFWVDIPSWERTKVASFLESNNIGENLQRVRADVFFQRSEKDFQNYVYSELNKTDPNVWKDPATGKPAWPGMYGDRFIMRINPHAENVIDQLGFALQTDWQLGDNHYLVAGYEMSYDKLDAHSWLMSSPGMKDDGKQPMIRKKDSFYEGWQMSNAIYASMESTLPHDLLLTYGARYTYVKGEMDYNEHGINMGRWYTKQKHDSSSDGKAVFNAGILWNGVENLTLRANYAQGYRTPILQELYIDSDMGGDNVKANPDLKPETSDNFEIGARWNDGRTNIDAVLFYSDAQDYIAKIDKDGEKHQANVAKAITFGLELSASTKIGDTGFEPYANLTMMKRQFDYGMTMKTGKSKTWDTATPNLIATYGVRWAGETEGMNVRWDAYLRTQTDTEYEDINRGVTNIKGIQMYSDSSYTYDGYTTFNLKGGLDFGAKKQYSMDFGLYNVFDKKYMHQGAIYEPGRHAAVKFNATF